MARSADLFEGWQAILPKCVSVVAGPMQSPSRSPQDPIQPHGEERQTELHTGGIYARRALALLGVECAELKHTSSGAIDWPAGIVGSLTHMRSGSANHCAVAVTRQNDVRALGIDAEEVVLLDPRVWLAFLTPAEISVLMACAAPERNREAIRRWSIKEAVIKTLPCVCGPARIETCYRRDEDNWSVNILDPVLKTHNKWDVRTIIVGDVVLAGAIVS